MAEATVSRGGTNGKPDGFQNAISSCVIILCVRKRGNEKLGVVAWRGANIKTGAKKPTKIEPAKPAKRY